MLHSSRWPVLPRVRVGRSAETSSLLLRGPTGLPECRTHVGRTHVEALGRAHRKGSVMLAFKNYPDVIVLTSGSCQLGRNLMDGYHVP